MKRKIISIMLVFALLFSNTTFAVEEAIFSDVEETDWFYSDLMNMYETGLISGHSDGTFLPNNEISVGEFIAIIYRIRDYKLPGLAPYDEMHNEFRTTYKTILNSDSGPRRTSSYATYDHWAKVAELRAFIEGLLKEDEYDTLYDPITRELAAKIVAREILYVSNELEAICNLAYLNKLRENLELDDDLKKSVKKDAEFALDTHISALYNQEGLACDIVISTNESPFEDVSNGQSEIIYISELELMNGYDDNTFRPNITMNRGESIKVLSSLLNNNSHSRELAKARGTIKFYNMNGDEYDLLISEYICEVDKTSAKRLSDFRTDINMLYYVQDFYERKDSEAHSDYSHDPDGDQLVIEEGSNLETALLNYDFDSRAEIEETIFMPIDEGIYSGKIPLGYKIKTGDLSDYYVAINGINAGLLMYVNYSNNGVKITSEIQYYTKYGKVFVK